MLLIVYFLSYPLQWHVYHIPKMGFIASEEPRYPPYGLLSLDLDAKMNLSLINPLMWSSVGIVCLEMSSKDLLLLISLIVYRNWHTSQDFLSSQVDINLVIDVAKTSILVFLCFQIYRYMRGLNRLDIGLDEAFAKPMLFPARTAHTRLFPTKHSFSYSYLLVGIPIGWNGSSGGMISEISEGVKQSWYSTWLSFNPGEPWFTVNGDDYLARGHARGGLQEKLHDYLESQVFHHVLKVNHPSLTLYRARTSRITPTPIFSQPLVFSTTRQIQCQYGISTPRQRSSRQ